MIVTEDIDGLTDGDLRHLADRLKPHLAPGLTVVLKRMNPVKGTGKTVAFADLVFMAGGAEVNTVHGFRLLQNPADGSMWLGLPQRTHVKDGETKYIDTFEFGNSQLEKAARRVVVDEYRRLNPDPFGGDHA